MNSAEQEQNMQNFRAMADAIATLFFLHAEAVLHDLRSQKVDYIANNLSKRAIGDDSALEDMLTGVGHRTEVLHDLVLFSGVHQWGSRRAGESIPASRPNRARASGNAAPRTRAALAWPMAGEVWMP